jgi:manganese/zinc/iron transport system substrate-binding protein
MILKISAFSRLARLSLLLATIALFSAGCSPQDSGESANTESDAKPYILCTTGMIRDAAENIFGDLAEVEGLMGPGIDPHYYIASRDDVRKLRKADLVLYNGIFLEGKMETVLENLATEKPVIALGHGVSENRLHVIEGSGEDVVYDPHIWFDPDLWWEGVSFLADSIIQLFPELDIRSNYENYEKEFQTLQNELKSDLEVIPKQDRHLVTSHDAFGYFGSAFDFEVKGLQGISTVGEIGLKDIRELIDYVDVNQIAALFIESSVSPKSIQSVVEGCKEKGLDIKIGGSLYSDALGAAGTPEYTYAGMYRHNVRTLVEALQKESN